MDKLKILLQEHTLLVLSIVSTIITGFLVILIALLIQVHNMKTLFEADSSLKSRQIQRLDSGIDFQNKRSQFLTIARDSVIKKYNKDLTDDEAYNIAEYTLYVCEKYKLDPVLFFAVGRQESKFCSKAVSSMGARGMYQIYPLTGRILCDALGMDYNDNMLFDLKTNMEMAGKYMSYLKAEYGSIDLILIGYNAGPKWVEWHKNSKIPLPDETRDYIVRVMGYYTEFGKLLDCYLPGAITKAT